MHMQYFGDSYDIVKQALLGWLSPFGEWSVHPMFTERASPATIQALERFLGARVISSEVLSTKTDRESYLSCAAHAGNLFLDPDTGIRLKSTKGARAPEYLFASELSQAVIYRPNSLTLVFDQSLPRGKEREAMSNKLKSLRASGIHSFAYASHACFIVASSEKRLVNDALDQVSEMSRLPSNRFVRGSAA